MELVRKLRSTWRLVREERAMRQREAEWSRALDQQNAKLERCLSQAKERWSEQQGKIAQLAEACRKVADARNAALEQAASNHVLELHRQLQDIELDKESIKQRVRSEIVATLKALPALAEPSRGKEEGEGEKGSGGKGTSGPAMG
ncbi:MAG: hypothetical protein SGPRY_000632 [Prymnesium sp.]